MIVARSRNGIIGNGDEIPWKVKGEQRLFKQITMGGTLVMGRKTFASIGKALPGRETIVISRNKNFSSEHCKVYRIYTLDNQRSFPTCDSSILCGGFRPQ